MKKLTNTFLLILLLTALSFAQGFKFGWITDVHIGSPKAEEYLTSVVSDINQRQEIQFVVVSGDVAEKGMDTELETAKQILDQLKVKYYIIPGNHDTKWSPSGCTKFTELFGSNRFNFDFNGTELIGINSGVFWRGGGGHFAIEDLRWLDSTLAQINPDKEIIFYVHHPLNSDVDNWFEVTNRLRSKNIKAVLIGHGHSNRLLNFNGIPAAMGRSSLEDKKKTWGYTLVENLQDSLRFFEINKDSIQHYWGAISKSGKPEIPLIDSVQVLNIGTNMLWKQQLGYTLSASLLTWQNKIYSAGKDGIVACFDLNGRKLWEFNTNGVICSRPCIADNMFIVGTIQGDLFTLDANKGSVIQTAGTGETITSQLLTIDYKGDKFLLDGSKPGKVVIIGTASGKVMCYDIHSLDQLWENIDAKGMIEALPCFDENKLIYGSWDSYLYCIDARSGLMIWKWTANKNFYYSPAACSPVTDGKYVYVTTPDKFTSAIDILLGKTKWRKDNYASWESIGISTDKTKLYIKGYQDKFYIVSPESGRLIKDINVKFGLDTTPNIPIDNNGNILFGSKDGYVYMIGESYGYRPLIFTGTSRVLGVQQVNETTFAVSNMDGKIFVFNIK